MTEPSECCRKDKILDAAETAFADLGFEGASLRRIVLDAEVNLATVYYYFGSKEGLMAAVFKRSFDPLKKEQLERLTKLCSENAQPVTVEGILEAILAPALGLRETRSAKNPIVTRLIGRIVTDPNPQTQELLRCQHKEVREAYVAAFQRILPDLTAQDLQWRLEFIWGALAFILCNPGRLTKPGVPGYSSLDVTQALPQMISFFSAGLRAPAAK